ncbi:ABC transporter ATP-binding protein [Paenibacillus chitinolyticus]
MPAIEVKDLRKEFRVQKSRSGLKGAFRDLFDREYNQVRAVKDISFEIPEGEICGYIGENGAGKSTTIKMLTGILVPTSGHLQVNGYIPYKDREAFVKGIGVVFGQRSQLWWDIGVIESFQLLKKVYRVPENDFKARLDELSDRLQLGELLSRPVRKLSLGQRMRCELAASLLHNPAIVFLDEPTIGLDIVVKTEIREFLKSLNQRYGTTILLTTHDLQDIEALCSRVIMLDDGRIIYDGGLDQLKETWGKGKEVVLQFNDPVPLENLKLLTEGLDVTWEQDSALDARVFIPQRSANVSDVLARIVGVVQIADIRILETNTDDIVREIYKSGSAEARKPSAPEAGEPGSGAEEDKGAVPHV